MKRMLIAASAAALITLFAGSANAATSQSANACQGPASWCSVFFGN